MKYLLSESQLEAFLKQDGRKLLLISSSTCPFCVMADQLLEASPMTLNACFKHIGKCEISAVHEYCQLNSISSTPTLIIFDNNEEISRINHAPTQEEFFDWVAATIL